MELKDVATWLGIEATDEKTFKEEFAKKYYTPDQIFQDEKLLGKFTGKTLGNIQSAVDRIGKAHGLTYTKQDTEGKKLEEIVDLMLRKKDEQYQPELEDLKKQIGTGGDEKIKEFQSKYEKLESKLKDTDSLLKKTAEEYEGYKKSAADQIKGVKLDYARSQVWSEAKFAPGTDPLKIKGFKADFSERYKIDLDENDQVFVADSKGQRIQNPAKHSEWLSPTEVLGFEIDKAGIGVKNSQAGRPAFPTQTTQVNAGATGQTPVSPARSQGIPGRIIHPRAGG